MSDELPLPPLPESVKPPVDPLKPAAGGWVPSQATVAAIGGLGATLGAFAATLTAVVPGRLGIALAGACGAVGGGLIYFAARSAGPRSL